MLKFDLQTDDLCHIEEILAGLEFAKILEAALKEDLFTMVDQGMTPKELGERLGLDLTAAELFVKTLERLGLIGFKDGHIFNTPVSAKYLCNNREDNAIDSLLRKETQETYLAKAIAAYFPASTKGTALNNTALNKIHESLSSSLPQLRFEIREKYSFILTEELSPELLSQGEDQAFIVILGRYQELNTAQSASAALSRYCQEGAKPLSAEKVQEYLKKHALTFTPLIPLSQVWGMIVATREEKNLENLLYDDVDRLKNLLHRDDVRSLKLIDVKDIVTADWVADHCRWGCSSYGTKCCPPNSPTYKETQTSLATYRRALLIEGEPPTHSFQRMMLENEKIAFKAGFYKAFAYWAGPCSLCSECKKPEPPLKCTATRPSMESAGIDVFATARKQGYTLETRKDKTEFVKYFGLLLLD